MYRFLLTRRWLVAGSVVLVAVVGMVGLALWQLGRHGEVRRDNDRVRARLELPVAAIEDVLAPGGDPDDAVYRRVDAVGRYDSKGEVFLDNRSNQGQSGRHLLTPLITEAGTAVIVDRGWVPLDATAESAPEIRPASGPIRVVGVLFPSERKGAFGPSLPPEGTLKAVPRIDLARLAKQVSSPVYPLYIRLESQRPPSGGTLPLPPGLPELDAGPHLSYAGQWFLFATVALAVFGALARREARKRITPASPD